MPRVPRLRPAWRRKAQPQSIGATPARTGRLLKAGPVLSTGAAALASQVSLALAGIISARALGPDGKGLVVGITAWQQILVWVTALGIDRAFAVRMSETPSEQRQGELHAVVGHALGYTVAVGIPISALAALWMPRVLGHLEGNSAPLVVWTMASIAPALLGEFTSSINLGLGRVSWYNLSRVSNAVVTLVGMVTLYLTGSLTASRAIAIIVAGSLVALVISMFGLPWARLRMNTPQLRQDIWFGCQLHSSTLLAMASLRLDVLVMAAFLPAAQVGLYSTANNVMLPVMLAADTGASLLAPAVARLRSTQDNEDMADHIQVIRREASYYMRWSLFGGVALFLTAPFVIPALMGPGFQDSVHLVWILIPGYVGRAYGNLLLSGTVGMRRPVLSNLAQLAGVVATAALLPILLPRFGAVGAAVTSTVSYLLLAFVAHIGIGKLRPISSKPQSPNSTGRSPGVVASTVGPS